MQWPLSVPVLSDGTVTLRAHAPADLDAMLEMARDPEMVRWTAIPTPHTREMTEQFALQHIPRAWDDGTACGWAIEAVDDDGRARYAGNVDVRGGPVADIGFALHPWARGRGIMAGAVRLATGWCFAEGRAEVVHWRSHVGNVPSLRVAHAAGFTLVGLSPGSLHERGRSLDAWTAMLAFGDPPLARTRWAESTVMESPDVRLRPVADVDLPRVVEACNDPVTRHWLAHLPESFTMATARTFAATAAWQAAIGHQATWAVADPSTDDLLGTVSVLDMTGADPTSGELSYWSHPDARGRGIMRSALSLIVAYALAPGGLDRRRLSAAAARGNDASIRLLEGAGFRRCGTLTAAEPLGDGTFADLHEYEYLR